MKRAEIKTGEVYAYARSKYDTPKRATVLNADTYFTKPHGTDEYVPAKTNRYVRGDGYRERPVGLLVLISDRQTLVNPARLLMTWAEWEVQDAAETERRQAKRAREKREQEVNEMQADRLIELWAQSGIRNAHPVNKHEPSQRVANGELIALLSTFVDSLANNEQAKEA